MPKRGAAREKAQATVDAAAASAQPAPVVMQGGQSLSVHVSPERSEALKLIAQGRSLEDVIADLIDDHLRRNSIAM